MGTATPTGAEPPPVTVVIPARNAEGTIGAALDSVAAQDYVGAIEVIVADGSDSTATADLVRTRHPGVRCVANPLKTIPHGLNTAIRAASGDIVVRCDSHAALPPGYIRRAVDTLARTGAGVVGGLQRPTGDAPLERAIGMAITTPLGTGDARYRLGGREGPVDTVYLGVFRSECLVAAGGFDPTLERGEDTELNWRLRKRGDTVWFDPELTVSYQPRSTLTALARQYFCYGRWKPGVLRRHPRELRLRHLASPLLVVGLLASAGAALLSAAAALAVPSLYAATLILGSAAVGVARREAAALLLPVVLAVMHLSWGAGFFLPAPRALARPRPAPLAREPTTNGQVAEWNAPSTAP